MLGAGRSESHSPVSDVAYFWSHPILSRTGFFRDLGTGVCRMVLSFFGGHICHLSKCFTHSHLRTTKRYELIILASLNAIFHSTAKKKEQHYKAPFLTFSFPDVWIGFSRRWEWVSVHSHTFSDLLSTPIYFFLLRGYLEDTICSTTADSCLVCLCYFMGNVITVYQELSSPVRLRGLSCKDPFLYYKSARFPGGWR